jgi:hypothetical protein
VENLRRDQPRSSDEAWISLIPSLERIEAVTVVDRGKTAGERASGPSEGK